MLSNFTAKGSLITQFARNLSIHEYQSKGLLKSFGVDTMIGEPAATPAEAERKAKEVLANGSGKLVVKSQIHAGGRGVGVFKSGYKGGVKLAESAKEAGELASKMLNEVLVTKQTGPDGRLVRTVYLEDAAPVKREMYLAILMDRAYGGPVVIASTEGGVDIETVAHTNPNAILKFPVDINAGMSTEQAMDIARGLKFEEKSVPQAADQIQKLYNVFIETDATQVEINPFAETTEGKAICLDAKFNFDDNAEYRHADIFEMRDPLEEDPFELEAMKHDLNWVTLDGNVGCVVNGAGLAMATLDYMTLAGGKPANFLDLGGGVNQKTAQEALALVSKNPQTKMIFINIFGGIVSTAMVARALLEAMKVVKIDVPLVIRLDGTDSVEARKILKESGLKYTEATSFEDGIDKCVTISKWL
ncbi:Succinyl-CoA synthetase beta subunit [Carpediemonas membranifera]|uniref:Succinate--CoA ligase [ADP-forming] subunit beta, mitochondrial n=1 Tax=Carpediemonas membranifera TaxID=201153 RepID=A0A8J6E3L1_9EUKA|nr:Succinyl-CoA synthetase beta subunit [Carpediemonas membranifera]|eukprot:KAG9396068.1 Succinyl-CoA synthetase beta subunit [Carpediemonas membranifera]